MYTTSTDYATYTGETAPADYTRQELIATTLLKSIYPNFPSESQFEDLDAVTKACIEYAIFEQISAGLDYSGTTGGADSFAVGNFSISSGTSASDGMVSLKAQMFLRECGATYSGVGLC